MYGSQSRSARAWSQLSDLSIFTGAGGRLNPPAASRLSLLLPPKEELFCPPKLLPIRLVFYLLIKHQVWEWLLPFVPKTLRSIHLLHMQNVWKILKRFLTNLALTLFPFFLYSLTYFLYFCSPKFTFRIIIYNLAKSYGTYIMRFFQKLKATADNHQNTQHHIIPSDLLRL